MKRQGDTEPTEAIKVEEEEKQEQNESGDTDRDTTATEIQPDAAGSRNAPRIKTEGDLRRNQAMIHRNYSDRVLLARQASNGMMKLGGGNTTMNLYPSVKNTNHPRFRDIGERKATAYCCMWQPTGPQFAGQPSGAVRQVYHDEEPFSLFMKRCVSKNQVLGWEYCGEYKYSPLLEMFDSALNMNDSDKAKTLQDIKISLKSRDGHWHEEITYWREVFSQALEEDDSPAAPQWMVERRKPNTNQERSEHASLAARCRALAFTNDMSKEALATLLVELDEFYPLKVVTFVKYDETIYNYVKAGETTRNAECKSRRKYGGLCAKASDWYSYLDQQIG